MAQNILVSDPNAPGFNNPSFERPDISAFSPTVDVWFEDGPALNVGPPFGVIVAGVGVFENPDPPVPPDFLPTGRLENMTGTQAAWLFANSFADFNSGLPEDHRLEQVTQFTFQAGEQYQLSVDLANAQAAPPPDSEFTMSLIAVDSVGPNGEILAGTTVVSRVIKNDGSTGLNGVGFLPFPVTSDAVAPALDGKPIGIRFQTHTVPKSPAVTGQWDLDNVQVSIVPEPTALASIAAFATLLGTRVRRCRRLCNRRWVCGNAAG